MVWSKDLAKLKQELKVQEGNNPAPLPVVAKPAPPPAKPKSLEEEDALFLAAIGKATTSALKLSEVLEVSNESKEFEEAMSQLKGIKPTNTGFSAQPEPELPLEQPQAPPEEETKDVATAPAELHTDEGSDEIKESLPEKILLAAGMTIEVDGQLDLRNYSPEDAGERLKEKVLDGSCLGWRSLHVILGNSEPLQQVFTDYINSPKSHPLTKYAQAPIPMGGSKAWILYYDHPVKV